MENEINNKTAVDDRRHNNVDEEGNLVVNMAMALSYRDLYRTCVTKAKNAGDADSPIQIPTYTWFLLQFWPCTRTMSNMIRYTGRFKVKCMVQAWILRKTNVDSHHTNALYSFLKERAKTFKSHFAMISSDAKCKGSVGEPGAPIVSVSRGERVVVGVNQTLQVYDHDYSKISLIPDATFIQTIPDEDDDTWYRGQVFYSIKDMALQRSTALRGGVEPSEALDSFYGIEVPERLYLYADGGGDRRVTHLQVQKALIAVFIHHDFDELTAARPAAYQSYRNPV